MVKILKREGKVPLVVGSDENSREEENMKEIFSPKTRSKISEVDQPVRHQVRLGESALLGSKRTRKRLKYDYFKGLGLIFNTSFFHPPQPPPPLLQNIISSRLRPKSSLSFVYGKSLHQKTPNGKQTQKSDQDEDDAEFIPHVDEDEEECGETEGWSRTSKVRQMFSMLLKIFTS